MTFKIVSDGSSIGVEFDDKHLNIKHPISSLHWQSQINSLSSKLKLEILNVPLEIIAKATITVKVFSKNNGEFVNSSVYEKDVKIVSADEKCEPSTEVCLYNLSVYDADANELISGIIDIVLDIIPDNFLLSITRIVYE